jgi:hypothetical protein
MPYLSRDKSGRAGLPLAGAIPRPPRQTRPDFPTDEPCPTPLGFRLAPSANCPGDCPLDSHLIGHDPTFTGWDLPQLGLWTDPNKPLTSAIKQLIWKGFPILSTVDRFQNLSARSTSASVTPITPMCRSTTA